MIGLTIIQKRPKPRSAKASLRGRNPNGAQVEQGLAAARADSCAHGHSRGVRRRHRLDDLDVVHPLPPLPGLRDRPGAVGAPVRAAVQRWRLDDLAQERRRAGDRQRARHRAWLHPRGDDREGEARRRLLPHDLPLSARGIADRHRHRLALDVQPRSRRPELPAPARLGKRQFQLAGRPGHGDLRHHPRLDLARARLLHGADAGRPEIDQHGNLERGQARRRELLAPLHRDHHSDAEVHVPDLRDPAVARRGQDLRHRARDDQWRAWHVDLDAGLFRHQRLLDPRQHRLRVGGRRHHAVDHGRRSSCR